MPPKVDLGSLSEADKLTLLQTKLLDQFLGALSGPKAPPAALLIAASRYLSSDPVQAALKKAATQAAKKTNAVAPLSLPTFPPDEYDDNGQTSQVGTGATIPVPRYGDPSDHL
jgi:ABC-type sugar transport system substrate-binding protein